MGAAAWRCKDTLSAHPICPTVCGLMHVQRPAIYETGDRACRPQQGPCPAKAGLTRHQDSLKLVLLPNFVMARKLCHATSQAAPERAVPMPLSCLLLCTPAVCSQIMSLPTSMYKAFLTAANDSSEEQQQLLHKGAPVLFVHMTRDEHTAAGVKKDVELRTELVRQQAPCFLSHSFWCPVGLLSVWPGISAAAHDCSLTQLATS